MSFITVPESLPQSSMSPTSPRPQHDNVYQEEHNEYEDNNNNNYEHNSNHDHDNINQHQCFTISIRLLLRCMPVLILFIVINCVRTIFCDQDHDKDSVIIIFFTLINIILGLALFTIIIYSMYIVIIVHHRHHHHNQDHLLLPPSSRANNNNDHNDHNQSMISIISRNNNNNTLPSSNTRTSTLANHSNRNNTDSYVFDLLEDLGLDFMIRATQSQQEQQCLYTNNNNPSTSNQNNNNNNHLCPHCGHNQTKINQSHQQFGSSTTTPTFCCDFCFPSPPPYEEPPKYEQLSADNLIIGYH